MKREIRKAIREGIEESDLNGYTWEITPNGLKWSYGEEFIFLTEEDAEEHEAYLSVRAVQWGRPIVTLLIGTKPWCDCSDRVEAYKIATKTTIRRANRLY